MDQICDIGGKCLQNGETYADISTEYLLLLSRWIVCVGSLVRLLVCSLSCVGAEYLQNGWR